MAHRAGESDASDGDSGRIFEGTDAEKSGMMRFDRLDLQTGEIRRRKSFPAVCAREPPLRERF